jgi:hypothetical protein
MTGAVKVVLFGTLSGLQFCPAESLKKIAVQPAAKVVLAAGYRPYQDDNEESGAPPRPFQGRHLTMAGSTTAVGAGHYFADWNQKTTS